MLGQWVLVTVIKRERLNVHRDMLIVEARFRKVGDDGMRIRHMSNPVQIQVISQKKKIPMSGRKSK